MKYVFVLFQENRSYDSYFGSFPGGRGLFAQSPGETAGYTQPLLNTDGTMATVQPFRIGPAQHAADVDDIDHSHVRMAQKMNVQHGVALMDRFALIEEMKYMTPGAKPSLKAKQYGELAMAYEDCDTIPFLWNYANRFVLFDTIFQLTVGPSAPGAISIIAGQTGETQWVKHPESASATPRPMPPVALANRWWKTAILAFPPINPSDRPDRAAQPDLCQPAADTRRPVACRPHRRGPPPRGEPGRCHRRYPGDRCGQPPSTSVALV